MALANGHACCRFLTKFRTLLNSVLSTSTQIILLWGANWKDNLARRCQLESSTKIILVGGANWRGERWGCGDNGMQSSHLPFIQDNGYIECRSRCHCKSEKNWLFQRFSFYSRPELSKSGENRITAEKRAKVERLSSWVVFLLEHGNSHPWFIEPVVQSYVIVEVLSGFWTTWYDSNGF